MKKQSVKKRIFVSNTLMVLVSLLIFFVINLFIIKGYSESVETEIKASVAQVMDKAALERFLQAAYRRTGEMETLLNQLFYFSKLETGNMPLSLQRIEIAAILAKCGI